MSWKKSIGVASLAVVLTALLLWLWPHLQKTIGERIPDGVYSLTREVARLGLFVSLSVMLQGLVPNMNRWRIGLYFLGTFGFLVNLLGDNNSGNVFLEAALTVQMAWSIIANWHRHEPMSKNAAAWIRGLTVMAIAYCIGLIVVALWPVGSGSEMTGWWWSWIAVAGGVTLFIEINLLETGVVKGNGPIYIAIHGLGCVLLSISYLGQYNAAGLTLNVALFCVAMYSFLKLKFSKKEAVLT